MKKTILILLLLAVFTSFDPQVYGASREIPISMYLNGNYLASDVEPFSFQGVTFVPIKVISDSLKDSNITWDQSDKSILIEAKSTSVKMFVGKNNVFVNENEYYMDAKPEIMDNRTMVPLEFIADCFDIEINYDSVTRSIMLYKEGATPPAAINGYTSEDVLWLARIVHVEANGTEYSCKLGIANVVLNRKNSSSFPNSIYGVIFQPGQFPPAYAPGFAGLAPSSECIAAAKNALEGENNISTSLYFNNRPFLSKSGDLYKIIDGEYFYY